MNKIKLWVDSRDLNAYEHFGQINNFPFVNFDDANIPEKVQAPGNVECTVYTVTYIGQNKTKKEYDIDELFSRVPHSSDGAKPNDVFNEVIKNGLRIKGTQTYDKPFTSYFRADTGNLSPFYNTWSAMILAQSPVALYSSWYREWLNLGANAVMSVGMNTVSGHMYAGKGFADISGIVMIKDEPALIVEWWGGYTMYMTEEVFNKAISAWGSGAVILADKIVEVQHNKTTYQMLSDMVQNLILTLKKLWTKPLTEQNKNDIINTELQLDPVLDQIKTMPPEPITPPTPSISLWSTRSQALHSSRVIMDTYNFTWAEKDLLCATIMAESQFDVCAIGTKNSNGSRDYGIVQMNDKFWIGEGKLFKDITEVFVNPEKSIRFMCDSYKQGHLEWWYGWKNGGYKNYLNGKYTALCEKLDNTNPLKG